MITGKIILIYFESAVKFCLPTAKKSFHQFGSMLVEGSIQEIQSKSFLFPIILTFYSIKAISKPSELDIRATARAKILIC